MLQVTPESTSGRMYNTIQSRTGRGMFEGKGICGTASGQLSNRALTDDPQEIAVHSRTAP